MASELADRIAARIAESSRNEQAETDRLINGEGWRCQTASLAFLLLFPS